MRIAIGGFMHESNTFAPLPADLPVPRRQPDLWPRTGTRLARKHTMRWVGLSRLPNDWSSTSYPSRWLRRLLPGR